jgi:hypothetical protein
MARSRGMNPGDDSRRGCSNPRPTSALPTPGVGRGLKRESIGRWPETDLCNGTRRKTVRSVRVNVPFIEPKNSSPLSRLASLQSALLPGTAGPWGRRLAGDDPSHLTLGGADLPVCQTTPGWVRPWEPRLAGDDPSHPAPQPLTVGQAPFVRRREQREARLIPFSPLRKGRAGGGLSRRPLRVQPDRKPLEPDASAQGTPGSLAGARWVTAIYLGLADGSY